MDKPIEFSIIEDSARKKSNSMQNPPYRHSRESGNPVFKQSPHSGQRRICGVVPLRGGVFDCLDSRLRGNDGCFMASVMNYGKINNRHGPKSYRDVPLTA